jgi:hypothetical protein
MKPFNVFALATLVTLDSGTLGFAQALHVSQKATPGYFSRPQKLPPQEDIVEAVIVDIDYELGVLAVDTEIGLIYLRLAPEEAHTLQVGDTIQVRLLSPDTMVI